MPHTATRAAGGRLAAARWLQGKRWAGSHSPFCRQTGSVLRIEIPAGRAYRSSSRVFCGQLNSGEEVERACEHVESDEADDLGDDPVAPLVFA